MNLRTWLPASLALCLLTSPAGSVPLKNAVDPGVPISVPNVARAGAGAFVPGLNRGTARAASEPLATVAVTGLKVLYAPSEADDATYRALIAARIGGTVDYFDARSGTPSAAALAAYDCVYTWSNNAYADATLFGNRLADFVDAGGAVILGSFCTYTFYGYELRGRIMTPGYSPVTSPTGTNHFSFAMYAHDGTSCLYRGVSHLSFGNGARDFLAIQGTGVVDGHYQDGEVAIAYRPDKKVVYINGTGASQLWEPAPPSGLREDFAALVGNAVLCSKPGGAPAKPVLYGSNRAGQLFWIDIASGQGTYVGNLPSFAGDEVSEIEYDRFTDKSYLQTRKAATIQSFSLANGSATGMPVPDTERFTGFEFVGPTLYGTSIPFSTGGIVAKKALYAPSEADDPVYRAALAAGLGGPVDYFDAQHATPSRELLATYDCVYTWANYAYANAFLFGDRLADFVDAGGKVILGVFTQADLAKNHLSGRIMTPGYLPITPSGTVHLELRYSYSDGTDCIHTGVAVGSYASLHRDVLAPVAGSSVVGRYSDLEIAHAVRADRRVVYSNGTGASQLGPGNPGWDKPVSNAMKCAASVPGSELRTIDPVTGATTLIGPTGVGPIVGLTFYGPENLLYGVTGNEGRNSRLVTIDRATGAATVVGPMGFEAGSVEFGPDGNLYAVGAGLNAGNLYRINRSTGAATLIGATGFHDVTGLTLVYAPGVDVAGTPDRAELALARVQPNPAHRQLRVDFTLPAAGRASLELFDVGGRRVEIREVGSLGPGRHSVELALRGDVKAGLYWLRLSQGAASRSQKVCVVR